MWSLTLSSSLLLLPAALLSFVSLNSFPLFGTIGPENYQKYMDRATKTQQPIVWFFCDLEKHHVSVVDGVCVCERGREEAGGGGRSVRMFVNIPRSVPIFQ